MSEPSNRDSQQRASDVDAEGQLGGADAVEKTTYVVGKGTDPNARRNGPSATVPSRGAPFIVVVVLVALMILVALAYLVGIGR